MTNSASDFDFLGLYGALLKDIALIYPKDHNEWERDLLRLTRLVEVRGNAIFTMDLPVLRKALDRGLADGWLKLLGLPLSKGKKKSPHVPKLFWGLWIRLFDESGCLRSDIDPNAVFALRTLLDAGKNLEVECAPKYLYKAVREFFDIEVHMEAPSSFWDDVPLYGDNVPPGCLRSLDERFANDLVPVLGTRQTSVLRSVQRCADRMASSLGVYHPDESTFRHGPGAVSDRKSGEYKYTFPTWNERLEGVFPFDRYGITALGLMDRLQPGGVEVEFTTQASKLIAVPKTAKGPRLIASEPSSNQWCQQNVRDFLYRRVSESRLGRAIHFSDQNYNREAALRGSRDGSVATIDLSSASDRIACWLVESVFRRNQTLLQAFSACRTRYLTQELDRDFERLWKLRKFCTMGSALTFPVQSLIFTAVAVGVGCYLNPKLSYEAALDEVLVFGDDIIVPNDWAGTLAETLECLGLKVNVAKTFGTGKFRESCGLDAWDGSDVTPPHITLSPKQSNPRSIASGVAVSNNFYMKGLISASQWLRESIGIDEIPVLDYDSGMFGFRSRTGGIIPAKVRWNDNYHRWEARCYGVFAKAKVLKQDTAAALLQYFTEVPSPQMDYESGVVRAGKPVSQRRWEPVHEIRLCVGSELWRPANQG